MTPPLRIIWAYTYRLLHPVEPGRLRKVRALIKRERADAAARAGTFEGRLVVDERIAEILILSDSPDIDGEVNRRIEAELRALGAAFAVTVPMALPHDPPVPPTRD